MGWKGVRPLSVESRVYLSLSTLVPTDLHLNPRVSRRPSSTVTTERETGSPSRPGVEGHPWSMWIVKRWLWSWSDVLQDHLPSPEPEVPNRQELHEPDTVYRNTHSQKPVGPLVQLRPLLILLRCRGMEVKG